MKHVREYGLLERIYYTKLEPLPAHTPASYVLQRVWRRVITGLRSLRLLGRKGPETTEYRWRAKCVQLLL